MKVLFFRYPDINNVIIITDRELSSVEQHDSTRVFFEIAKEKSFSGVFKLPQPFFSYYFSPLDFENGEDSEVIEIRKVLAEIKNHGEEVEFQFFNLGK